MPASPVAQKSQEVDALIQEFHQYTKNWANRLKQVSSKNCADPLPDQVVQKLFTLIDVSSKNPDTVQYRIQLFVSSHLHLGLSLKDLSDFLGYSEKYCSEFFRQQMGESFSPYLKRIRLRKAEVLLHNSLIGMAEIAESLGFRDQFAFSHFFKKSMGVSPREFRNHSPHNDSETAS